jgi:quercetin dioxygenase-like cupin family protein
VELSLERATIVGGRNPNRRVVILRESPELDVTWSRFAGGERGAALHVHREHVDAFHVLEGVVTFTVGPDAEKVDAPAGTFVLVPPGVVHGFDIDTDATTTYLNFHAPSTGFAAYLRRERDGFDSFDPPADGGRPVSEAVVLDGDVDVSLGSLTLAVGDAPAGDYFVLGPGRVLNIRAGA